VFFCRWFHMNIIVFLSRSWNFSLLTLFSYYRIYTEKCWFFIFWYMPVKPSVSQCLTCFCILSRHLLSLFVRFLFFVYLSPNLYYTVATISTLISVPQFTSLLYVCRLLESESGVDVRIPAHRRPTSRRPRSSLSHVCQALAQGAVAVAASAVVSVLSLDLRE
jgi:hypothetical protein